ncbi:ArnT family glycosyltransferase [Fretibacter rubidus]|uniref:ArnT family glycosyltransferase n=1 Tax=Fretibacter rubidus TaxID=570162 RepID=UPI00352AB347
MTSAQTDTAPYAKWTLWLILGLLVVRLTALVFNPLGLHGDEAQYWAWSKDLDWGYFTKPPLIAWVIWTTTSIFGDAEWAVRLSSAPLHALTTGLVFSTARKLFDARTGFWAALIYALMPAQWLSSQIVSTDVSLLLFYALALHGWVHLRDGATWVRAGQLGLAIGFGMLAKYAMLFFLPALVVAIVVDKPTRQALVSTKGILVFVLAAVLITPNILWNLNHDFATLSHTAANANMSDGPSVRIGELVSFFGDQFGVFGPISFALLLGALVVGLVGRAGPLVRLLAVFSITPLLVICVQAFLSRANANWAVTTYVAGAIVLAFVTLRYWPKIKRWLVVGLAVQAVIGVIALGVIQSPKLTDELGLANSVKRLRAWRQTVENLEAVVRDGHEGQPYQAVMVDKRIIYYDLLYYGLPDTVPTYMWKLYQAPENHAELKAAPPAFDAESGPILFVNYTDYIDEMREDFERLEPLPALDIDLGGGKRRTLRLWAGYGFTPTTTR